MVVKGSISFRDTLQLVIKVNHDFTQRHLVVNLHPVARHIILPHQFAALAQTQCHDRADVIGGGNDRGINERFLDVVNQRRIGHTAGIMHLVGMSLLVIHHVRHVGHGRNHIHIKLAVQTFLNNLHVKQSQKTATESEAQSQ